MIVGLRMGHIPRTRSRIGNNVVRLFSMNSSLSILVVSALVALSLISSGAILIQTQAGADTCSGSFVHGYCIAPYANLNHANLHDANLGGADMEYANLHRANLTEADLRDASLISADLHNVELYKADLSDADLSRAFMKGANLSGADLSGAICPNGKEHGTAGSNC